jgi:hypothetical protein
LGVPKSLIEHLSSLAWVLHHLEDLESDFSVFHRVEDMYELDAERFWIMAQRIIHYGGATAVAVARATMDQRPVRVIEDERGAPVPLTQEQLLGMGGTNGMG